MQSGSVLYLLGLFIFLFSEINAVLITRDSVSFRLLPFGFSNQQIRKEIYLDSLQDFRLSLIKGGYAEKVDGPEYKVNLQSIS